MFTTCFCCNQWTDRHYHSQSHDANSACSLTMCALRLRFSYTCTFTSAPLLTRNSRHRAPCVEAAAKCSGVKPLLFGWLTLAPQSISSLTTASWPLKQAKWSAVFPKALDSSICGQSNRQCYNQEYLCICTCINVCVLTSTARFSRCLTTAICPLEAAVWRGVYPRLSLQLISAP